MSLLTSIDNRKIYKGGVYGFYMNNYEKYRKKREALEELAKTSQARQEDDRTGRQNSNREVLYRAAYDAIPADQRPANPDELTEQQVNDALIAYQAALRNELGSQFEGERLDDLIANIPDEVAGLSALIPDVGNRIKDSELVKRYVNYKSLEILADAYKDGKNLPDEHRKTLLQAAAKRKAKEEVDKMRENKEFNYSEDTLNAVESLVTASVILTGWDNKNIRKYGEEGLRNEAEKAKKRYEEYTNANGVSIYDSAKNVLNGLLKGDTKNYQAGKNALDIAGEEDPARLIGIDGEDSNSGSYKIEDYRPRNIRRARRAAG